MDERLRVEVKERLSRKESPAQIRVSLVEHGYSEEDVEIALGNAASIHITERTTADKRNSQILSSREVLDRVGYGTAAPQFLNILFFLSGASLFFLGLVNGIKAVLTMLTTSTLQEYARVHRVSKNVIAGTGIVFGFTFLIMAFAVRAQAAWLYALGFLVAGVCVVVYGDLYNKFLGETIRREKMGGFLSKISGYGILITMIAMLLSGWIIDMFPEASATTFKLFGMTFHPVGYLISFEITAFAFILSGYLLSLLNEQRQQRKVKFTTFLSSHYTDLLTHARGFLKNKYTMLLILATLVTGLLEVLGQSYYGVFIYQEFKHTALGGFLNVALLYSIAILASFTGPWFTQKLQRAIGLSPMLVFGTLLTAILPFTLVFNPNILAVSLALIFSVIGASIIGIAQGLLTRKLIAVDSRRKYFMCLSIIVTIPYLLFVPLGSWFAQFAGMEALFTAIGIGLVIVVMPLYFLLVSLVNAHRL